MDKTFLPLTQSELFRRIGDICAAVNVAKNSEDLLEISLKETMSLFGAQRGSIFVVRETGKHLVLKSSMGMALGEKKKLVKKLGEGVMGRVAASKKPIVVNDIETDERFQDFKARRSYRTPSFICAPLLFKDKLLGVINLADKVSGERFSESELQLLDFLSSQIALNYRRAKLYQKFKSIVKESRNLKDELGRSSQEAKHLKKQVVVQEKLATIGKLAGGIAHEFNNPLDGVMRYTNLCLEQVGEDDVVRTYLLEIKHGLNRMANIVKSLLACARNTDPTMLRINPDQAIDQAIQSLQPEIANKEIAIEKALSGNPPELIDLGFDRIVINVLRNAIDAVARHGRIHVSSRVDRTHYHVVVLDNGIGIAEQDLEKIFEPFYTTKDIDKGCGLGLTIVTEIIKNYEGRINVESSVNKGTTFTISIPLSRNETRTQ